MCSAFATKRLLCGLLDEVQVGSDKGCPELAQIWVNADGGEILGFGFRFRFLILCQRRFGEVLGEGIRILGSWGNSLSLSLVGGVQRGGERERLGYGASNEGNASRCHMWEQGSPTAGLLAEPGRARCAWTAQEIPLLRCGTVLSASLLTAQGPGKI